MAFTEDEIATHAVTLEHEFWSRRRPKLSIHHLIREGQRFAGQSIELFYARPVFSDPSRQVEEPIAKLTYVRTSGTWRIFWQLADLKWHRYTPQPEAGSLAEALHIVDQDANCCFFG